MPQQVINVVIAGLGGQGVLKASDILADAVFAAGCDVKKADVHGMSQRGGSVRSDVRFGPRVYSPMVPEGGADFLLAIAEDQSEPHRGVLAESGTLLSPANVDAQRLSNRRSVNVALLGALSRRLDIEQAIWHAAICKNFKPSLHEDNLKAFEIGRQS